MIDPVNFAQDLIRSPSVTPADAGAMDVVQRALEALGFRCRRMNFGDIENLYARRGRTAPHLCFAGHTDVVPPGDLTAWSKGPFDAAIEGDVLYGRGAVDMKGAIAAYVAAVARTLGRGEPNGSLSFLITGDEEGVALHGTKKVVETLLAEGEVIDHCIVGEPSSSVALGDMIKVGRRGSLNAVITVQGVQGHVAYPHRAANPIPVLIRLLDRLQSHRLDDGYPQFQPSNLEVVDLEVGNPTANVIPARAQARLNIRFNPSHKGETLVRWIHEHCKAAEREFSGEVRLHAAISGEAFLTEPGGFTDVALAAVEATTGRTPELSTTGGTSDARFIRALCPVIELGLVGTTMHMVDERTPLADITALSAVYERLIDSYFATFSKSASVENSTLVK